MLKVITGLFVGAWALLALIVLTGHLAWDNKLLWGPAALLGITCFLGLCGLNHSQRRMPLLVLSAASFCCLLLYFLFYLFVFAYSGY
jgi:hypothetical protein